MFSIALVISIGLHGHLTEGHLHQHPEARLFSSGIQTLGAYSARWKETLTLVLLGHQMGKCLLQVASTFYSYGMQ